MSETNLSIENPYLIEDGTQLFISEPTILEEYVASELGLSYSQINFTSSSAELGQTVLQFTNNLGYLAPENFSGTDVVTLNYTTTTGLSGTLEVPFLVVNTDNEFVDFTDNGESPLRRRGDTGQFSRSLSQISDKIIYYGFDNYITEADIVDSLTDTLGTAPTVEKINAIYLSTNGDSRSSQIRFEEVSDGVWKIFAEDIGDVEINRPFNISNNSFLVNAVINDDGLGTFTYEARLLGDPAPAGYVQPEAPSIVSEGVEGVDFWYDGAISPNFDQDAFWYRGGAPLEAGGESKYWFKFKNTDTTDVITGGGEYALVATKRDALDNGASLDSLTGDYVFSKSFVSPDGIRLYAGIDEAAVRELSNNGAEDIEVYRWDVTAGQIVGTDGREILAGRLDNRFDTIGEEYAGSLSELNNNAYVDTLA